MAENSEPLQPFTCEDLRLLLTEVGIINRLDVHIVTDYHTLQLDLPELPGMLYLLYTNRLIPEFFCGIMLPYAVFQQLSHLVLLQIIHLVLPFPTVSQSQHCMFRKDCHLQPCFRFS